MDKRYFSVKIVKWYENHRRDLPWRETNDPYKIWLSEIILQQTRVIQGIPYYQQFVQRYPTVGHLASAPLDEVLRLWQGLGYYTRARNLHKCARTIVAGHKGRFPDTYKELLGLPGVGEYTAAAIASICFGEPVAVVDGNVFRLLSRISGIGVPINSPEGRRVFSDLANSLITVDRPDLHNQAVMEYGAMVCTPKNPDCEGCIFQKSCVAFRNGTQAMLPVKLKAKPGRKRYFYYIVTQYRNSLLMRKRIEKDIWTGLFDFQLIEKNRPRDAEKIIKEQPALIRAADDIRISRTYKHILTHQTIFTKFIVVKTGKKFHPPLKNHSFYTFSEIAKLPKPILVDRFLTEHYLL